MTGPTDDDAPTHPPARHVLVVADGDVPALDVLDARWPGWSDGIEHVIAADGGLDRLPALRRSADLLVGDLDSVDPARLAAAIAAGLPVRRANPEKDESDAELALVAAAEAGATRITFVGALGGPRLDHGLANVWLLAHAALAETAVVMLDADSRVSMITAPGQDGRPVTRALPGRIGGTVSLLPFAGTAEGVTTAGMRYPLRDEPLLPGPARGLSNVRADAAAAVTLRRGRLLVIELAPDDELAAAGRRSADSG